MALLSLHTNVIKHVRGNTPLLVIAHKRYENARGNKPFLDIVFKRNEKTHEEINPYLSSQTSMQTTPSSWPLRVLTKVGNATGRNHLDIRKERRVALKCKPVE